MGEEGGWDVIDLEMVVVSTCELSGTVFSTFSIYVFSFIKIKSSFMAIIFIFHLILIYVINYLYLNSLQILWSVYGKL